MPQHDGFVPDTDFKSDGFVPDAQPQPKPSPGIIDSLGGWRGLAGTGIRALSGILSSEGGPMGAGISGIGEGAAELAEGSGLSPVKMGVEAGFGAIPFGKVVKAGELLPSILRSGALGAAHTGVSEVAGGQTPDVKSVATGGVLGGAMGALGSFLGRTHKPSTNYEVMPTDRSQKLINPMIKGTGEPIGVAPSGGVPSQSPVPVMGGPAETSPRVQRVMSREVADAARQAKLDAQASAAAKIEQAREAAGVIAKPPSFSESLSAPAEGGGTQRMSTSYAASEPDIPDPVEELVRQHLGASATSPLQDDLTPRSTKGGTHIPVTREAQAPPTPEATSQESPLAKLLRPSRSAKTSTGFQGQVDKTLSAYPITEVPQGVVPDEVPLSSTPEAPSAAVAPQAKPDLMDEFQASQSGPVKAGTPWYGDNGEVIGHTTDTNGSTGLAPIEPPAESPMARFFKSRVDAAGQGNRDIKAAKLAGEQVPEAGRKIAGKALQQEAKAAGLPTRGQSGYEPTSQPGAPESPPGATPESQAATPPEDVTSGPWVDQESNWIDRLKKAGGPDPRSETGAISPLMLKLLTTGSGALVGAPTGAYLNPDDPGAPIKGALAGGMLGWAGATGAEGGRGAKGAMDEFTNYRNAGLLFSPSAQLKKPLSDLAGYIGLAGEKALAGDTQTASNMGKELLRLPTNASNYAKGFMNPTLTKDVVGDTANAAAKEGRGWLGAVARPFAGAQYATQQAMQRAGVPLDAAREALFLGNPKSSAFTSWLNLQQNPYWRAVRPFARIGTNIAERGLERTPIAAELGAATGMLDPESVSKAAKARWLLGSGAMGAGALVGSSDQTSEDAGNDPTNPLLRGLRRAALGSYALPFTIGEGLTGPRGIRDSFFMMPGLSQTLPPPAAKETGSSYAGKFAKRWLSQMLPDWANPYPDESVR